MRFQPGQRVVINNRSPYLAGTEGVVIDYSETFKSCSVEFWFNGRLLRARFHIHNFVRIVPTGPTLAERGLDRLADEIFPDLKEVENADRA